jgi:competence CoiA-like predicted nuclease
MVHSKVIKRIEAYKKIGYKVIFITAAPQKTSSICAQYFQVDFESSKTKFGFITRDLLAKKIKIYKNLIANNYEICAIYSDSKLDLSKYAKKNILINSDGVGKVHRL